MEQKPNGTRYDNYSLWESTKQTKYDFKRDGLLNKIMSKNIVNTDNPILKIMLNIYEYSIIFIFKYIDILKNFKNIHWSNR